jgi:hypothetical protein
MVTAPFHLRVPKTTRAARDQQKGYDTKGQGRAVSTHYPALEKTSNKNAAKLPEGFIKGLQRLCGPYDPHSEDAVPSRKQEGIRLVDDRFVVRIRREVVVQNGVVYEKPLCRPLQVLHEITPNWVSPDPVRCDDHVSRHRGKAAIVE